MNKPHRLLRLINVLVALGMLLPSVALALDLPAPSLPLPSSTPDQPISPEETALVNELFGGSLNESSSPYETPFSLTDFQDPMQDWVSQDEALNIATSGRLLFAPIIDLDENPASNPISAESVPVIDLMGQVGGITTIAAQLEADNPDEVPINIPVHFRVWNESGTVFEQTVYSDVWGAAAVEVPFKDIEGEFAYQVTAPGFGTTEVRYFHFDTEKVSHILHADGAQLESFQDGDFMTFRVFSPVPLDADRDEIVLNLMRRSPVVPTDGYRTLEDEILMPTNRPSMALLPEMPFPALPMRIISPQVAELVVQLPVGEYGAVSTLYVHSDPVEYFYSQPVRLDVILSQPPATPVIWASSIEFDPGRTLVQHQATDERLVFSLMNTLQVPAIEESWEGQSQLLKVSRTGPFEWQETLYDVNVQTFLHDGKKAVALENFDYDPISQSYTIAIKSFLEEPITDTLTIEVVGPGGVVIYKEVTQVVLQPDRILRYSVTVPAELGKPEGIIVTLDDPLIEMLQQLEAAVRSLAQAVSVNGSFNSFLRLYADLFGVELITYTFRYTSDGADRHEFEFPLYDELMRDPWELLVRLGGGALDGFNINIFGTLKNIFFSDKSLDEILDDLFKFELGGIGADWGKELSLSATADFGDCPEDADVQDLEQRLAEIADRLDTLVDQYGIDWNVPTLIKIPLHALVAISVRIRIQLGGEVEANGLTIRASAQGSVGINGRVLISLGFSLKLAGWTLAATYLAKLVNGVLFWVNVVGIVNELINVRIPNGDCDPDPPDPRPPDERQDVWQGVESFYQGKTHEETISNLNQFISRAQEQGLWRAERLLTLRLREAELNRFLGDRAAAETYLEDSLTIMETTNLQMQDILSGTVPLPPGQTISETLTTVYLDGWSQINALEYPAQQEAYITALDVAERSYMDLMGQELELQSELRQLFTGNVVGVLATGFAESTLSALGAMGLPSQLVSPWPSQGEFRGKPAPYLAPGLAPRALIVPSGGLHNIANSPAARDWLDAYVAGGGLLVAFSQAFGDDWLALPGGAVDGVGYEEDQRWQHATVEAAQPSDWLVWMGIAKPDIQIDGAFTAWPPEASVLLKRTFGSYAGSPVMLEYEYGQGTVLATTAYGDWAWQTNFWWGDDARMTHSVLIRAYLLSQGLDVGSVFTGDPANTVSVAFPLTNNSVYSATQAHLQIPLVWGSGSNSSVATVPVDLGNGETGTVNAIIPTPPVRRNVHDWTQVGLYRVRVTVSTADGGRYTTWGPFVYVRSPIVPPAVSGILQVAQQPASLFDTVAVSVTLRNYTSVARTVIISDVVGLPVTPSTVSVPPNSTIAQSYNLFMDGSQNLSAGFYDDTGELIGRSSLVVNVAYPDLRATPLIPQALADGTTIPVRVLNQARQGQALAATLVMTLTAPSGAVIWTDTQNLPPAAAGEMITPTFTLNGTFDELGVYQLAYRVDDGRNLARTATVPLPAALVLNTHFDKASYRIRDTGTVSLTIANAGRFELSPVVSINSPDLNLNDSQPLVLPVNNGQALTYGFNVDTALAAGTHEVVVSYQVGATVVSRTLAVVIPPASIRSSVEAENYNAGDTIVVTLSNPGGVDAPLATTLQLIDNRGQIIASQTASPTILAGESDMISLPIPGGAAAGAYQLILDGEITTTGLPFGLYENLAISGVTAGLTVQTGQPDYFSDESIAAQATLGITSGSLNNGSLNLRVCAPTDPLVFSDPGGSGGTLTRTVYQSQNTSLNWVDIASTGTVVAQGDDTYSLVNLGFTFEFYGSPYSQVYIGSNGYLTFGSGNSSFSNTAIPNPSTPNNAVYVLWTDLYPIGGTYGNIYAQQIDANRFVVQWQGVNHYGGGNPETMQVILDNTDNSITLQYQDVNLTDFATVGVENVDGSGATQVSYNQSGVIVDGAAFYLTPEEEIVTLPAATYKSYLYTVGDVIFFSYEDNSELALYQTNGTLVWQGTLNTGQQQLVNVPTGTYLATGSQKFSIMSGDPVSNGVAGYYASDQNGFGVSTDLYTWVQRSFFSPYEYLIVFSYEDGTNVTVEDATTGQVYFSGTLDNGDHWQANNLHQRWLHVTADNPVSAYTYYDQGSLVPSADGRWSGTLFYTYAGLVGFWRNDVNIIAFEDNTQVTLQNLDTGVVYWTGTLNSGQIHTEVFGGNTARGAAYLSVSSDNTVAVTVSPFVSFTGSYHQGFYAPDASGSRIGTDIIAPMLSGGTMQVFAYYDETVVEIYNSVNNTLYTTLTLQAGQSVNANPGYGLWRLRSNKPVSAWAGWGQASAEFAPVLFGNIVVGTPYDNSCGYVLWETDLPVTTSTTFNANELVDPLNVTGRLVLDGRLYAETGQLLAHDDYSFYLHDRDTALTLETDRTAYQPGETVQVSGYVTNTSTLTASFTLELTDGSMLLLSEPLTLAPNEGHAYSTSLVATAPFTLTATASNAETSRVMTVAEAQVAAALVAPDVVGRQPFSVTLVISNTGVVPAAIDTVVVGEAGPSFVLQPGEQAAVSQTTTVIEDTVLVGEVTGDAAATATKSVIQGELAALDLQAPDTDVSGLVDVPYLLSGVGQLPASGQLLVMLDGAPLAEQPFVISAGDAVNGLLTLDLPVGRHLLTGQLVDDNGNILTEDTLELVLFAQAEPALPDVAVQNVTISPNPVAVGGTLVVTVEMNNQGAAGPIIVGLQLFDPEQQWIINPPAFATGTFTFDLTVPADLPAGEYFGELIVDGQHQPITVQVAAADIEMTLTLDKEFYFPGEVATLTVTLTDLAGVGGDYLVMPRYLVSEDYYTITVPANTSAVYTFNFTVTEADRVNVFLANTPAPPEFDRRVLLLDSLPVPVVQPSQGAYLTFDKLVYDPGDTIHATLNLTGTLGNAFLMGPMELTYEEGFILWAPQVGDRGLAIQSTYNFSYTLPTQLREGRYTFLLQLDGQTFTYPVDVRGWKVTTRHITLDSPRYNQNDEITAVVEFWNENDAPINGLQLSALIFTPNDEGVLTLSPVVSQSVNLQPGLNVFTVQGNFSTTEVGSHRLLVNIGLPGKSWRIAGASTQFDVGWAHLVELTTDHGNYAPGDTGMGRLDVYGYGPTQLLVTASDGSTLLDQLVDLSGFSTFTFAIPTTNVGNYLLVAQSTDQDGNNDQLVRAYAVPTPADLEPPTIALTYPNTRTLITSTAMSMTLTVTGQANDNGGPVTVLVNGQTVTPDSTGAFSLPVELREGLNLISAVAVDEANNIAFTDIVPVLVAPAHHVSLSANLSQVNVGQPVIFTVVITATGTISDVVILDYFSEEITGTVATVSAGTVTVSSDASSVTWIGSVSPGQPVSIDIEVIPQSCGPLTNLVSALWGQGLIDDSNEVTVQVVGTSTQALYPIGLSQSLLQVVQPGQTLGNMMLGSGPGNFGWLSWTGANANSVLATSLTPPGDAYTYINPNDPNDHEVSSGDRVFGTPGLQNSSAVRAALDLLIGQTIRVPVWDSSSGSGNNTQYHVVDFALVQLTGYELTNSSNRITATYIGSGTTSCN